MSIIKVIIAGLVVAMTAGAIVFVARPEAIQVPVGAVASPDIPSPYVQWGGLRTWNFFDDMAVASTTCSFQAPASTSTLRFAGARVTNSSTGATLQYEWGKGATAYATTTGLGIASMTTGAQGTILATSTQVTPVDDSIVFAPNTFLNLKVGSSTPTTQAGNCYAQFVEIL